MDGGFLLWTWFGLVEGVAYAVFATSLSLVFGVLQVINMAHGELFMLGPLLQFVLMEYVGLNYWAGGFLSVVLVGVLGLAASRVAIQPLVDKSQLPMTLLSTVAISMIILHGVLDTAGPTARLVDSPFSGFVYLGTTRVATAGVVLFAIGLLVLIALHLFFARAKLGKEMRATDQNRIGASLIGIDTKRVFAYAMVLAAILAAIGGVLLATLRSVDPFMGQAMLIKGFAIVVVAGMGNMIGATVVGISIGIAENLFSAIATPYLRDAFTYAILVIVLLLRPQGLFGSK